MYAIGDAALVVDDDSAALCDTAGVRRRFASDVMLDGAHLEWPARFAMTTRNRGHGTVGIDVIDVASGDVQRRFEEGLTRVAGFLPRGDGFLAQSHDGLFVVDDRGLVRIEGAPPGAYRPVFFDADGRVALCRCVAAGVRGPNIVRVDVAACTFARVTEPPLNVIDFVVDAALARCAAVVHQGGMRVVRVGDPLAFEAARAIESATAGVNDPYAVRVWSDRSMRTVVIAHHGGRINVYALDSMRDAPQPLSSFVVGLDDVWALPVDVDRRLVLERTLASTRIIGLDGRRVADVACTASCFAADGVACVVGGALSIVDARGSMRAIEGPTKLVDVAPHRRGVLVLDDEMRAHVIEIGATS